MEYIHMNDLRATEHLKSCPNKIMKSHNKTSFYMLIFALIVVCVISHFTIFHYVNHRISNKFNK